MERTEFTPLATDPTAESVETRRVYVSPVVETLGSWQAVALAYSVDDK